MSRFERAAQLRKLQTPALPATRAAQTVRSLRLVGGEFGGEAPEAHDDAGTRSGVAAPDVLVLTPHHAHATITRELPRTPLATPQPQEEIAPRFFARPRLQIEEQYRVLHRWEGVVTAIEADYFQARVREFPLDSHDDEYGDFSMDSVSEDDAELLVEGAVFYWFAGYRTEASGQRTTWSSIRFRRVRRWSKRELDALDAPSDLDEFFGSSQHQ
jgi:hypothetical protein